MQYINNEYHVPYKEFKLNILLIFQLYNLTE
jgi:hypothetical protein